MNRVDAIIPALNEEASLPLVLGDLPSVRQVIVVDNGSTDGTADVAKRLGAVVIEQPQRGYGAACLLGLALICEQSMQDVTTPQVVVFLDADYSDHPDRLAKFLRTNSFGAVSGPCWSFETGCQNLKNATKTRPTLAILISP